MAFGSSFARLAILGMIPASCLHTLSGLLDDAQLLERSTAGRCNPCQVRLPSGGERDMQMDIYGPGAVSEQSQPVVLAFYGANQSLKDMQLQCEHVFAKAGFVCASFGPVQKDWVSATEKAMLYLDSTAQQHNANTSNIFLYGFSEGCEHAASVAHFAAASFRARLRGMIADSGASTSKALDWSKTHRDGSLYTFPPYLMMHCGNDEVMPFNYTVKASALRLAQANLGRSEEDLISWHGLRFTADTGCAHNSMLLNAPGANRYALSFANQVLAQKDPFADIPNVVSAKGRKFDAQLPLLSRSRNTTNSGSPTLSRNSNNPQYATGDHEVDGIVDGTPIGLSIWIPGTLATTMEVTPKMRKPVVFVFYPGGRANGNPVCARVFKPSGFVCVSADFNAGHKGPPEVEDASIKYIIQHTAMYEADVDNIFLYGYDVQGTFPVFNVAFFSTSEDIHRRVKGLISDSGSPTNAVYDWQETGQGTRTFPPLLLIHCGGDTVRKPKDHVKKLMSKIDQANALRPADNQIQRFWLKYTQDTGCSHDVNVLYTPYVAERTMTFMNQIVGGGDPDAFLVPEVDVA